MRMVIVTGMSGAGKSTALKVLEDAGYYCCDNMPISLVIKFAELASSKESSRENIALGVDIRSGDALDEFSDVLEEMGRRRYDYRILFLDANDDVLVKRYKETRRAHPLANGGRIDHGIRLEREKLRFLKDKADYIIDTSQLLTRELKQEIEKIFVGDGKFSNLYITVLSFGFKYGIPLEADLVFDVRFLPNPFYVPELKHKTGMDSEVYDYVFSFPQTKTFIDKLEGMLSFLLPLYAEEGKSTLVIAVGCTGGHHRSVSVARCIASYLTALGYPAFENHRDITRG